ncbi:hypothetical protein AgCh_022925 [Apium graveolens]
MEEKRRKRAAENQRYLEETGLKKLAGSLISEKLKKMKKSLEECWAECDREYTPGHDSLENSENEEVPTANVEEIVQPVHGDLGTLPPPPPLHTDLAQFKKLKRAMDNDGVDTMSVYMALKKLSWNRKPHMSLMLKKKIWGRLMTRLQLLEGDEDVQTKAVKNAGNRKKDTDVHNAGRTSFTQIAKKFGKPIFENLKNCAKFKFANTKK